MLLSRWLSGHKLTLTQYISKINKQNFDLKLEIFHRTQQITGLAKDLERMQELEEEVKRLRQLEDEVQELRDAEEDNRRLRESNEELQNQLDKRDDAVAEAVELICQLETKVEELESGQNISRPSTARPLTSDGSNVPTPKIGTIDIPERTSSKRATIIGSQRRRRAVSPTLQRAPSFLRGESKSTAALRGLFAPNEAPSHSTLSVMTHTESLNSLNGTGEAESPRISTLSECSELNPYDSPTKPGRSDQLDTPTRKTLAENSRSSQLDKRAERRNDIIRGWMQPESDTSPLKSPKQKYRAVSDFYRPTDTPSPESDAHLNVSEKPQMMFGGLRLPPTPDTMGTTHATATNHSNGSLGAGKSYVDEILSNRRIVRPRSADDLNTRRNSSSAALPDSIDANVSDAATFGLHVDGKDETPAIFPLYGLPSKSSRLFSPGASNIPTFGFYGGATTFNGSNEELAPNMNGEMSPKSTFTERQPMSDNSSSPTLASYDWIEAAKMGPRSKKEVPNKFDNPKTRNAPSADMRFFGVRNPSQASSLTRRHSLDSSFREHEPSGVPTLDPSSLEPHPQPPRARESRRRISFRPPFFNRSSLNPRRLQSSPMCDVADEDDGAPSPVVRKTRQTDGQPRRAPVNERRFSGYDDFRMPASYTDKNEDYVHKTLPRSFTESNMSNAVAARPSTANSKEHKRRSSLGIFSWMKGASGIGKKAETNSPAISSRPSTAMLKEKTPIRSGYEDPDTPEFSDSRTLTGAEENLDTPYKTKTGTKIDDQDQKRRPRYMDRRTRRP